jgi:uncharacterized protein (TIGR02118 family)
MVTSFSFLTLRGGSTEAEFRAHWRDVHAPLVSHVDYLRGYIQNRAVSGATAGAIDLSPLDGVAEFWWDDRESALRAERDPRYTEHARLDEPRFLDMGRIVTVQATPVRLLQPTRPLPTGATKALLMLHRQASLPPAAFAELCLTAWQTALADTPGSVDDCVLHLADLRVHRPPPVDAIIVCRWRNAAGQQAWGRAPIPAPGSDASDSSRSTLLVADEHAVLAPPPPPLRVASTGAQLAPQ